jgi:hypothetical protein
MVYAAALEQVALGKIQARKALRACRRDYLPGSEINLGVPKIYLPAPEIYLGATEMNLPAAAIYLGAPEMNLL